MFFRNLSVSDFVREDFFVSCAQISLGVRGVYGDEIQVRLAENRPQRQVQEKTREDIHFKGGFSWRKKKVAIVTLGDSRRDL